MLLVATLAIVAVGSPTMADVAHPPIDAPTEVAAEPAAETAPNASTDPTQVLEDAEATLEGETVETPQEDTPVESPSLALADLVSVYPELSDREQDQADDLLARPDQPGNTVDIKTWTTTEATPVCGDHVCVHYVRSTSDKASTAYARTNRDVLESVWSYETSTLGYRAPASDGTRGDVGRNPTPRFDVYLADIGAKGYYGYCAPEGAVSGQPSRAFAYCVLENDFAGFPRSQMDNLKVTAAHEFFHAIQYNYDVNEDRWLMEATSTWMEERYADSVNDNRQYLKFGQMGQPGTPLNTHGGLTHYGNWVFFEKFSQKYGVGSVRSLWNRLDANIGAPNQSSVEAIRKFIGARGSSLTKFYAHFAAGNLAPARAYSEGSHYKATKFKDTFKFKAGRKAIASQDTKLRHLTSKSYRFKAASSLHGKWKLRIHIDGPGKSADPGAVAYVYFKNGKLTKKFIKLNKSGVGSAKVKISPAKISRVTLSLVNASTRSNDSKFEFRANVVH